MEGKIALITGGDSGIGRSVATLFSLEGCKGIGIVHLEKEYEVGCSRRKEKHDAAVCNRVQQLIVFNMQMLIRMHKRRNAGLNHNLKQKLF